MMNQAELNQIKVSKNQITFLDLFESKQNPKRNKYE